MKSSTTTPKPRAAVIYGEGIGCHLESKFAYEQAGAQVDLIHINELLGREIDLKQYQIINFSGGFLNGDILGAGMCAANELLHSGIKDELIEFATPEHGGVIYGQCNGFQLLVKTGLLPGTDSDYSKQTATLTGNVCDSYVVSMVPHIVPSEQKHFAFQNIPADENGVFHLWCRHAEGNLQFRLNGGSITPEEAAQTREDVLGKGYVLLKYAEANTGNVATRYPDNPNGSDAGIAGLINSNGRIMGNMAHPEVHCISSTHPNYFKMVDKIRRENVRIEDLEKRMEVPVGKVIFKNIVNYVR